MRLSGKRALVTAAGAGIGRATALAFAQHGARVTAADIDADALAGLPDGIDRLILDVTNAEAIKAAVRRVGPVNVLFNAVGIVAHGTILDCEEADLARSLEVNVASMYRMIRAFLPGMLEGGGGSIVNVASVASSVIGVPDRFAYGTTKAAVIGLTKSVARDYLGKGVRCNAICPGTIDTPSLAERMAATGDAAAARAAFIARQPMGRLGTPEEIAHLAVYLASDESAFTTGQIHVADGGWTV